MRSNLREELKRQAMYELARRNFWEYCKTKAPDFYKEDRAYLKEFCDTLQKFYEGDKKVLVVNMPPRHGKSRTLTLFVQWVFGKDNKYKVMTGSYNEILSATFATQVRDAISEIDGIYSNIFPQTKIKYGEGSKNKWALEGNEEANYLATSPTGTATGFGCKLMIIDDLIKNVQEAYNENILQKQIDWFNNTMLSRTEIGFKIIIVMTRWASNDLAGYILENYDDVIHINYKVKNQKGEMLCDKVLNEEEFVFKTKNMNKDIVYANYYQEPIDLEGRLYKTFKTYTELPKDESGELLFTKIKSYTDTADEGSDFLCSIIYGEYNKEAYILDVYYTKDGMEITEKEAAKRLYEYRVNIADIESNNGGKGWARNVEANIRQKYNSNKCVIKWFHQGSNKIARIISNSAWVMEHIYFPVNWANRWPEYYEAMVKYQKEGKNAHDDAPDATTGIAEKIQKPDAKIFDKHLMRR